MDRRTSCFIHRYSIAKKGEKTRKIVVFKEKISQKHLMGFMMTTWEIYAWPNMTREEHIQKIFEGIDIMAEAMK